MPHQDQTPPLKLKLSDSDLNPRRIIEILDQIAIHHGEESYQSMSGEDQYDCLTNLLGNFPSKVRCSLTESYNAKTGDHPPAMLDRLFHGSTAGANYSPLDPVDVSVMFFKTGLIAVNVQSHHEKGVLTASATTDTFLVDESLADAMGSSHAQAFNTFIKSGGAPSYIKNVDDSIPRLLVDFFVTETALHVKGEHKLLKKHGLNQEASEAVTLAAQATMCKVLSAGLYEDMKEFTETLIKNSGARVDAEEIYKEKAENILEAMTETFEASTGHAIEDVLSITVGERIRALLRKIDVSDPDNFMLTAPDGHIH